MSCRFNPMPLLAVFFALNRYLWRVQNRNPLYILHR